MIQGLILFLQMGRKREFSVVDVRAFKTRTKKQISKSLAETAKYTVKDNDYLVLGDEKITDSAVMVLDRALANRRLVAYGGELKKIMTNSH